MSKFTFDFNTFSDLYKDAYGYRPRGHRFYDEATTDEERQWFWDRTVVDMNDAYEEEVRMQEEAVISFKKNLQDVIDSGAGDEETALRWMVAEENFYSAQCLEHWVYNQGLLFTDYGRELDKRLRDLVTFGYELEAVKLVPVKSSANDICIAGGMSRSRRLA